MSASPFSISQMLELDPQMGLPRRPKLPQALTPVWYSQTMLVLLGAAQPVTLRGAAVSKVLPDLLPLLDGSRSLAQVRDQLPHLPARVINDAVSLLFMRGVLEEGDMPPLPALLQGRAEVREVGHWLSRYIDVTRVHLHRQALMAHMQAQHVLAMGDSERLPVVLAGLRTLGLGRVTLVTPSQCLADAVRELADPGFSVTVHLERVEAYLRSPQALAVAADVDLSLLLQANHDAEQLLALNRHPLGRKAFYALLGQGVRLGPGVVQGHSSCAACAERSGVLIPRSREATPCELNIAAGRAITMAFSMLSKFVPMSCVDQVEALDRETLRFDALPNYRHSGCSHCAAQRPVPGTAAWLPWFYHSHTVHQPFQMVPKGHRVHYAEGNRRTVAGAFKTRSGAASQAVAEVAAWPPAMLAPAGERRAPAAVDVDQAICTLVQLAAGRRTSAIAQDWEMGFRFTPSAGGMASQNLYLINFSMSSLAAGVYLFNPNGEFQRIGEIDEPLRGQLRGAQGGQASAVLVIAAAHARLESKYMNTAYRYVHYDAGAMLGSLQWLAPALGLRIQVSADFDDDCIERACDMQRSTEFPMLWVALEPAELPARRSDAAPRAVRRATAAAEPVGL